MPSCASESCNSRSEHIMPKLSTPRMRRRRALRHAGHIGAGRCEGADEAGPRIGPRRTPLQRLAVAGVDGEHAQPLGVRMLHGRQDLRDDEGL